MADITDVALRDEFVYLAVIMDVYTRAIRGWHLSRSLDRELTLTTLRRALPERVPLAHHSDQGVQYACWDYTELLLNHGVRISMAAVGKPEENGYAERLMRTIKKRWHCPTTGISTMQERTAGASWMTSTPTSVFIPLWAISRQPSLKRSGSNNGRHWLP